MTANHLAEMTLWHDAWLGQIDGQLVPSVRMHESESDEGSAAIPLTNDQT